MKKLMAILTKGAVLLLMVGSLTAMFAEPAEASGDDYPEALKSLASDSSSTNIDPWGFNVRNCTSFVAWRLSRLGLVFKGSYLTGPNGQRAFFGNAGTWAAAAKSIGFAVDTTPEVGAVAEWSAAQLGSKIGHLAIVMDKTPDANGKVLVEDYNWSERVPPGRYDSHPGKPTQYIHFERLRPTTAAAKAAQPVYSAPAVLRPATAAAKPAVVAAKPAAVAPKAAPVVVRTPAPAPRAFRLTATVILRNGPSASNRNVGSLRSGTTVTVVCQTRGSNVGGSTMWDRLSNGTWVSDYYVNTPAFNNFTPGLPRC